MRQRRANTPLYQAIDAASTSVPALAAALGLSRISAHAIASQRQPIPRKHVPKIAEILGLAEDEVRSMSRRSVPIAARSLVRQRGLTNEQLQDLLGLNRARVTTGLNGVRELPLRAQIRLAEILDVPVEQVTAPDLNALDELLNEEVDA